MFVSGFYQVSGGVGRGFAASPQTSVAEPRFSLPQAGCLAPDPPVSCTEKAHDLTVVHVNNCSYYQSAK